MMNQAEDLAALRTEEAAIVDEFSFFDSWEDKYRYLIDLGKNLVPLPADDKVDENKVAGCQAQVWFVAEIKDGRVFFRAESDAAIVSGLIALLLRVYSGRLPETILKAEPEFVVALELTSHLSPTRSNGLSSMIRAIHTLAARALKNA